MRSHPSTENPPHGRRTFRPSAERLEVRECLSGGLIDPTFNGGAPETSALMDLASATAIQPDGKMVVVGRLGTGAFRLTPKLAVARFNPDGSPDASFGSGGVTYSAGADTTGNGVVLQPDGKILVCGNATVKTKGVTSVAYLVSRYNANGTLDTSFATKGTFTWDYGSGGDERERDGPPAGREHPRRREPRTGTCPAGAASRSSSSPRPARWSRPSGRTASSCPTPAMPGAPPMRSPSRPTATRSWPEGPT